MKFTRIFAMFMFAAALTGSMPVQAEGVFDWFAGLFDDKPAAKPAQPVNVAPVAPAQSRNAHNGRGKKHRRNGRTHNQVRQARIVQQPHVRSTNPRTNPRARSVKIEKMRRNLTRYAGLIAAGIVISAAGAILLNPTVQQKIRDILGYAQPAQDVNNLFRDVKNTAKGVKDFAKNVADILSGDEEDATQQQV